MAASVVLLVPPSGSLERAVKVRLIPVSEPFLLTDNAKSDVTGASFTAVTSKVRVFGVGSSTTPPLLVLPLSCT